MEQQTVIPGMEAMVVREPQSPTPMSLLQLALSQNADLEKLSKLMDLQERWEKNEARKAFVVAMGEFKANPPLIEKNKLVSFTSQKGKTEYRHATLDHVANAIGQSLSNHGLSFRWNVEQANGRIKVTCFLQHAMGHTEQVTMEGAADDTGNKNAIQQVGSTVTYLQRYTLLSATGMATADQDNDGAMLNSELMEQVEWIENAKDAKELQTLYLNAYKIASAAKNAGAMAAVIAAKNKRNEQFKKEGVA